MADVITSWYNRSGMNRSPRGRGALAGRPAPPRLPNQGQRPVYGPGFQTTPQGVDPSITPWIPGPLSQSQPVSNLPPNMQTALRGLNPASPNPWDVNSRLTRQPVRSVYGPTPAQPALTNAAPQAAFNRPTDQSPRTPPQNQEMGARINPDVTRPRTQPLPAGLRTDPSNPRLRWDPATGHYFRQDPSNPGLWWNATTGQFYSQSSARPYPEVATLAGVSTPQDNSNAANQRAGGGLPPGGGRPEDLRGVGIPATPQDTSVQPGFTPMTRPEDPRRVPLNEPWGTTNMGLSGTQTGISTPQDTQPPQGFTPRPRPELPPRTPVTPPPNPPLPTLTGGYTPGQLAQYLATQGAPTNPPLPSLPATQPPGYWSANPAAVAQIPEPGPAMQAWLSGPGASNVNAQNAYRSYMNARQQGNVQDVNRWDGVLYNLMHQSQQQAIPPSQTAVPQQAQQGAYQQAIQTAGPGNAYIPSDPNTGRPLSRGQYEALQAQNPGAYPQSADQIYGGMASYQNPAPATQTQSPASYNPAAMAPGVSMVVPGSAEAQVYDQISARADVQQLRAALAPLQNLYDQRSAEQRADLLIQLNQIENSARQAVGLGIRNPPRDRATLIRAIMNSQGLQ